MRVRLQCDPEDVSFPSRGAAAFSSACIRVRSANLSVIRVDANEAGDQNSGSQEACPMGCFERQM